MNEQQEIAENRSADQEQRIFRKTWGAEYVAAGEVRFRIWAPATKTLGLRLGKDVVSMTPAGEGWYELLATNVAPRTPYAFILPDGREVPDPAGRALISDIHGASQVIDPYSYRWKNTG